MYFYLITFFIIMFSFTRQRLIGLAVVLGIFFVAAKTLALPTEAVQVVGSPMIVEFLAGAVIAVLMTQQEPLIRRLFPSPIPIALIASGFGIIALSAALPNPSASRGIIWGPAGTVIVLGAALSTWKPRGYPGRLAVFLGTASYSIYLTHGLVTLPLGTLLKRNIGQSVPPDLIILIGTIVTILGCSLLYLVCERPLLHWLRPRKPPPPLPAGVSERYSVKVSNVSTHETDSAG
jgi:peptidoglycan/LPS O-acetylase OafA/YrhL